MRNVRLMRYELHDPKRSRYTFSSGTIHLSLLVQGRSAVRGAMATPSRVW